MEITSADIQELPSSGFGYLGHSLRTRAHDRVLANAADMLSIPLEVVSDWADSRYGRHFMDRWGSPASFGVFGEKVAGELLAHQKSM
jgi:hypothetical protein